MTIRSRSARRWWVWWVTTVSLAVALLAGVPGTAAAVPAGLPHPAVWPVPGPPAVLAGFDPPRSAYGSGHRGIDLAAPVGDRVATVAAGTVLFAGPVAGVGVVVVGHGGMRTTYQPLRATVRVGATLRAGQAIGTLTAGSHCAPQSCLHLGLLAGATYLDPLLLFDDTPAQLRLLSAAERSAAEARAQDRAAAAAAAAVGGPDPVLTALAGPGPPGRHGFARPVPGGITSPFGRRFHPILHIWKLHDGTDLGAACGAPIRAPAAGVVVASYFNPGYGNRLIIDHGVVDGRRVQTAMNHAQGYVVGVGTRVGRGQLLGSVGATGYATGCHLHLMVWLDGGLVDPMTWFG